MKPFDIQELTNSAKPAPQTTAQLEPNAHLKQRLWQLLLPGPDKAVRPESSAAQTSASAERNDERSVHSRSAASELAATAYLLAGHVQQLSLYASARATPTADEPRARANLSQAVTLRVDANTETGGLASLEVSHPELGQVGLAVELSDGAVRITATTTSARSAEVIQQGQAALAQRLLHQGIALEALDVVIVNPKRKGRTAGRSRPRSQEQET